MSGQQRTIKTTAYDYGWTVVRDGRRRRQSPVEGTVQVDGTLFPNPPSPQPEQDGQLLSTAPTKTKYKYSKC